MKVPDLHSSINGTLPDTQKKPQKENSLRQVWEETVLSASFTPKDILGSIIDFLDQKTVAILSQTKKSINALISTSKPIQRRFLHKFADEQFNKAKQKALDTLDPYTKFPRLLLSVAQALAEIDRKRAKVTLAEAQEIASHLNNDYTKSLVLHDIAKAQIELEDFEKALGTLDEVKKLIAHINNNSYIPSLLYTITKAQIEIGISTKNKEILAQAKETALLIPIENTGLKYQALTSVAEAEHKIDAIEEAKKTILQAKEECSHIGSGISKSKALIKIAEVQIEINAEDAKKTIDQAKDVALLIEDILSRSKTLSELAKALTQIGIRTKNKEIFAQAKDVALLIEDTSCKFHNLREIAEAESKIGAIEDAKKTLAKAKELALLIKDSYLKPLSLNLLLEAQIKIGAIEDAKETLDEAKKITTSAGHPSTLVKFVQFQAQLGISTKNKEDVSHAKRQALLIDKDNNKSTALTWVAEAQSKIDAIEDAKVTLAEIKKLALSFTSGTDYRYKTLKWVAKTENEIGAIEDAKKTLIKAKEEALLEKKPLEMTERLLIVAETQFEIGAIEDAKETVLRAKEAALLILDISSQALKLVAIAKTQITLGDLEGAKDTLLQAKDPLMNRDNPFKSSILKRVVEEQSKISVLEGEKGHIAAARKLLHETSPVETEDHIAIAQAAIELANIVQKSPHYTY